MNVFLPSFLPSLYGSRSVFLVNFLVVSVCRSHLYRLLGQESLASGSVQQLVAGIRMGREMAPSALGLRDGQAPPSGVTLRRALASLEVRFIFCFCFLLLFSLFFFLNTIDLSFRRVLPFLFHFSIINGLIVFFRVFMHNVSIFLLVSSF